MTGSYLRVPATREENLAVSEPCSEQQVRRDDLTQWLLGSGMTYVFVAKRNAKQFEASKHLKCAANGV